MEYHKNTGNFYIVFAHDTLCNQKNIKVYDNIADVQKNVYIWEEYKKISIAHLNNNTLLSLYAFKKFAAKKLKTYIEQE